MRVGGTSVDVPLPLRVDEVISATNTSRKGKEVIVETRVDANMEGEHGMQLAYSSFSDLGWLLIMVFMAGDTIGWVERFCRASEMAIHRRIVVLHHGAYGYGNSFGGRIECHCSLLLMRSREGASTSLDVDDVGDMPSRVNPFDD
ncbi:hypothetical protein GOP47_0025567 [Adiantum capillus-veneris]|uniref:Uncharacterized protein n=1 Tax=Adiantum capillus-veneris TaxID=13818 RepID=A0A9D4U0T3_ADICA|nr:hypothetical protein GOP47_0025567 [Adiantum capillus-veneris]